MLDCHTHRKAPYPLGVVNATPGECLLPGQAYSMGLHPWYLPQDPAAALARLALEARQEQVTAIGECGLDSRCDTPMWLQVKAFTAQVRLAEELRKPLIIHCVKTAGELLALKRELASTVPWIIHGFRAKPTVARMLLEGGCYLSYGLRFNPDSLRLTPPERLLAETDDDPAPITAVLEALREALAAGYCSATEAGSLPDLIRTNTDALLALKL